MASTPQSATSTVVRRTRSNTLKAKIREELICAICLDFLDEPKVLYCAHSFCVACLEKYKNRALAGPEHDLECPSCRQVTKLSSGSVQELNTNFVLRRLVSLMTEDEKRNTRELLSFRQQSIKQKVNDCPHHNKAMEYFCMECEELLCPKCISSTHKGHNFEDADTGIARQLQELRSWIQPACEVADRAESVIETLSQESKKATNNSQVINEAIQAYFGKVRTVIDQRESALKSTVQKYTDIRQSQLDSHYQMLQNHHDAILVKIGALERLIEDNDVHALLAQKRAINEYLETQEQSVMSISDLVKESSSQSTLLFQEGKHPSTFSELGTLNESHQKPNSPFIILRRLVISEEEDPYLDVPLRFEDRKSSKTSLQKHMRVDETKQSSELEPKLEEQKSGITSIDLLADTPQVPARKSSKPELPPLPPQRPRLRRIAENTVPRSVSLTPACTAGPNYVNYSYEESDYENQTFDIGSAKFRLKKNLSLPSTSIHDLPSSGPLQILNRDSSDSEEDVLTIDQPIATQLPKPPVPLPRMALSSRSLVTTQKHSAIATATKNMGDSFPRKKRSATLPTDSFFPRPLPAVPAEPVSFILPPVRIINNKMMSSPSMEEIVYPNGICCCTEMSDQLVVTDVFNHCLRLLDSGGTFIERIGREGRSVSQFKEPSAVTIDSESNLLVTERDNPRVQKFTAKGRYITKFGQKTLFHSQLGDPVDVAITCNDTVLISDWDKSRISVYTNKGKLLDTIVVENNSLKFPAGLAVNHKSNILVTDRGNHCVWEVKINGKIVRKIGSKGNLPGQLMFPYGVLVLSNKFILISESGNNRISIYSESGEFIRCFGEKGSGPGQFDHPRHMCENSLGEVVIVDQVNQRLQTFRIMN